VGEPSSCGGADGEKEKAGQELAEVNENRYPSLTRYASFIFNSVLINPKCDYLKKT
jgi:hypothetical protein